MASVNVVSSTQRIEISPSGGVINSINAGAPGGIGPKSVGVNGYSVPPGGSTNQTIIKNSSTNGDFTWGDNTAANVRNTASGLILATNVQAAVGELVSDESLYNSMSINEVVVSSKGNGTVSTPSWTEYALVPCTTSMLVNHQKMISSSVLEITMHVSFFVPSSNASYDFGVRWNSVNHVTFVYGATLVAGRHTARVSNIHLASTPVGLVSFVPVVTTGASTNQLSFDANDTIIMHIREIRR